ncbi:hypothetical protein D6D15_08472 [Aureobasidium pullulans]|uniref:DUF7580 domain-containing protein n=1 Tax=Aureobasidium pullulans TaxID=5580 RepID=A0A4S9AXA4_AURPU|nr:hypothetical protein D6D15_08472 [Aureobasidium pullulans]
MSGLEVVGVILAVPPLIVSCLEHYRQVFEYMGTWRKFRAEYSQCKTQVETLVVRLDMTLDRLFLPSAKSKTDFERLKKAPSDNAWIEVEAKLRERLLPNVGSLYVSNMKDLQDAVQELRHVLAFDNKRLQEGFNQTRALYRWEQHRFSIGATPRAKAFEKVDKQLDRLTKLLVENDGTAKSHVLAEQSWSKLNPSHITFWRHAQAAYNLITKSWCCACRSDHRADLALLQHSRGSIRFDVDFLYSQDADATDVYPWSRLTTRILKDERIFGSTVKMKVGSVQFAANPEMQLPITPTSRVVSPLFPPDALPEIADLCFAMSGPNLDDRWLGRLVDRVDQHVSDEYYRKVRYEIAMALVSSHLQLHSSPWLEAGWTNTDIYFAMDKGKPQLQQPYLRRAFTASPSSTNPASFDLAFATLGLVLTELCFGKTLSATPYRAKYLSPSGFADPVQDRMAAWDWAGDLVAESGQEYCDAVYWCLRRLDFRRDWRVQFHSNVVEVLETAYKKTWPE